MAAFRSILFPVDFSERCRLAAPFVKAMAARCQAELVVLHVIELPVSIYSTVGHDIMLDLPAMRRAAGDQLETFVQAELAGVPLRMVIDEGHAAPQIGQFAVREKVDLVMMPTHGYGPFRRALLGSVTAKVLHDVACPVWTDAHVEVPLASVQLDCKSLLCAVDLDPKNIPLIRCAAEMGSLFSAKVRLVHAIPEAASLPANHFEVDYRRFLFENAAVELKKMQAEAGTAFDVCMESGSVAKVVRAAAEHHQADLIVIGRGAILDPMGRPRTNTYAVIRESICPVLSW